KKKNCHNTIIIRLSILINLSAVIVLAIVIPRRIVTKLDSSFCAERDNLFKTPHTRIKFLNIRNPISTSDEGAIIPAAIVITIGNAIRAFLEIFLLLLPVIRINLSFLEVSNLITGG